MKTLAFNLKKIEKKKKNTTHCNFQIKTQSHYAVRKEMKTLLLEHNRNGLRLNITPNNSGN